MKNYENYREILVMAIFLVIAMLYSFLSYLTPYAYDDLVFMAEWKNANGTNGPSIETLFNFWQNIRQYDNGRIANTLSPFSTLFSPWKDLFPFVNGVLVACIIAFMVKASFREPKWTPLNISVMWCACLFLLPWRNALFVADYSLNYIWSAAITLVFIFIVLKNESRGWNIPNFIVSLIITFLAAGWHEGFAFATLGGFLLFTVVKKGRFSPQWYIIGLFYFFVALGFFYCPGLLWRVNDQLAVANTGQSVLSLCFDFIPVIFLLFLLLLSIFFQYFRRLFVKAWDNPWFVIGSGCIVVGCVLSMLFTHQPRSAFWPDLMAIIMIFFLFGDLWTYIAKSRFTPWITTLALVSAVLPMYFILSWQYSLNEEHKIIIKKLEKSESGTIFYDIIDPGTIPPYTLKITNHPTWVTGFHYHALKELYGKPLPAVIPTELETDEVEKYGIRLGGNSGALLLGNSIVLPYSRLEESKVTTIELELKNGQKITTLALELPYLTPSNKEYTYLRVYNNIPSEDIISVSLE